MKLPPMALTAPSLCPRCDSPALSLDECAQCSLPLRRCGSCFGVAGPFDRYCGFCGHELVLGRKQSPAWRLWLLVGLVPILVALAIGLSPVGQAAVRGVAGAPSRSGPEPNVRDRALGFSLTAPAGWRYHPDHAAGFGSFNGAQGWPAMSLGAANGTVVELGRANIQDAGIDPRDPVAVLASETAKLLAAPPNGYTLTTVIPVRAITVGGRPGAETVISVTDPSGASSVFQKVYIAAPSGALFLFEAAGRTADLPKLQAMLASLRVS
jgi:hypothetical protein